MKERDIFTLFTAESKAELNLNDTFTVFTVERKAERSLTVSSSTLDRPTVSIVFVVVAQQHQWVKI